MVIMPAGQFGDFLLADGAYTPLFFPQIKELPPPCEVLCHFKAKASFKVQCPGRVIWIGRSFNFGVPFYGHGVGVEQLDLARVSLVVLYFSAKHPLPVADGVEIFFFDPPVRFPWMPAFSPLPQTLIYSVVYFAEGLFA